MLTSPDNEMVGIVPKLIMKEIDLDSPTIEKIKKIDYPLWNQTARCLPPRMIIVLDSGRAIFAPPQITWLWEIRDEIQNQIVFVSLITL